METNNAVLNVPELRRGASLTSELEPDALHACKILIIDDEEANVRLLWRFLERAGFANLASTTDSCEGAALFAKFQPDLVLTDWLMPGIDGFALIASLRALTATDEYLPIVVLTADVTPQTKKRALSCGATDFLTKPFDQIEVLLRIQNLLNARLSHLLIQTQNANLEESVRRRTRELERALAELQRVQQQVIQQERLAALGTMASGIAHDFNNALGIIIGFSEILLRDVKHGLAEEKAVASITTILTAAGDAAKIVRRLREFHSPDQPAVQREPVDLNRLIGQIILLTHVRWQTEAAAAGRTIEIKTDFGDVPNIAADPAEMREVLTNLIFNAADALPQGGEISFSTRCDGQAVSFKLSDNGIGMSEAARLRCFEPFFTTKGEHGTGLGLSMVFGIVQRNGGSIDVQSELGKGTVFTLRLPQATQESIVKRNLGPGESPATRVLVVDDEPILSQQVCTYLKDDLHSVETASSGWEALEKLRAARFDLVMTNAFVGDMSGEELAVAVKALVPKTPVILLTAYAGDSTVIGNPSAAIDFVLGKPLSRPALRQAFAKALATKAL
jgi:signal transduction histidine kinase